MVDSCSDSSSLFSSSDVSSCSTASTKDSGNTADFSDYIFGEMAPNWDSHYGFSSNSATYFENLGTDYSVGGDDPCRSFEAGHRVRR